MSTKTLLGQSRAAGQRVWIVSGDLFRYIVEAATVDSEGLPSWRRLRESGLYRTAHEAEAAARDDVGWL